MEILSVISHDEFAVYILLSVLAILFELAIRPEPKRRYKK